MLVAAEALSQNNDEGKITVEITKEVNGEKNTFKGEYNSREEMHADPNYQEFAGAENDFNFWFSDDEDVSIHMDQFSGGNFFRFFDDEDDHSFFHRFDSDSMDGFFNFHSDDMNMDEFREHMKKLGVEMGAMFRGLHDDEGRQVRIFEFKKIKVTDVEDEFGKRGQVDESNLLELEDLSFYPNPATDGQLRVRFTVPDENDLSIKVSNLEGEEVFTRYFDRFSGTYSENIDLSGQEEGIYLLEISQGKRRIMKKLVIN